MTASEKPVPTSLPCDLCGGHQGVSEHPLWTLPPEVEVRDLGIAAEVSVVKRTVRFCEACVQARVMRWRKLALKAAPITAGVVWLVGSIALAISVHRPSEPLLLTLFFSGLLATFPGIAFGGAVFLGLNLRAGRWPAADLANNNREKLGLPSGYLWDHPPKRVVYTGANSYRIEF